MSNIDSLALENMYGYCGSCVFDPDCPHYMDRVWWKYYFGKPITDENGDYVPRKKICGRYVHKAMGEDVESYKRRMIERGEWE